MVDNQPASRHPEQGTNPEGGMEQPPVVPSGGGDEEINNIVGQIDPKRILDDLNHSLKGEYYDKGKGIWTQVGDPLINDKGRGWIISFFTSVMNNASTMGIIDEKQFSYLMEGIIKTVTREFRCNLGKFGFINSESGTPDTSRMNTVAEMIYQRAMIIYSRSLKGSESKRIFQSLKMADNMDYGGGMENPQQKKNFISRLFGGK